MDINQMFCELVDVLEDAKAIAKEAMNNLDFDGDSQAYGKERAIEGAWDDLCDLQSRFNDLADFRGNWNY